MNINKSRCPKCNATRKGLYCWKCGAATFTVHPDWEEPEIPPVDLVRELAREVGYAIGEHGSRERDLDLIAAPWVDNAVGNYELIQHIAKGLGARVIEIERKPRGRYAATIQMDGWYKNIDLSVCPVDTDEGKEIALLRDLMREAVIMFHGKRCVFSREFVEQAEWAGKQSEDGK